MQKYPNQLGKPAVVLFDLSGVLFRYEAVGDLTKMRGAPFGESELSRFWSRSRWATDFAVGRCSQERFADGAIRELGLHASRVEFLEALRTWVKGYLPGAEETLLALRPHVRLACFSNTNEIDSRRFRDEFRIESYFADCFFSNEIGMRKPDEAAYRAVLDTLAVSAGDVLFLDDTPECVEGALRCGIRAKLATGPLQARELLKAHFRI